MSSFLKFRINDRRVRKGLKKLSRELRGRAIVSAIRTALEATTFRAARDNLKKNNSIFQGTLFKSLGIRVLQSGAKNKVEAGTIAVRYGKNIEEGTPPGLPIGSGEFSKLIEWVRRKMTVQSYEQVSKKTGKTYTRREYVTPSLAAWIATRVAAKIKAKGIAPAPFLMPAWRATKDACFRMFVKKLAYRLGFR